MIKETNFLINYREKKKEDKDMNKDTEEMYQRYELKKTQKIHK